MERLLTHFLPLFIGIVFQFYPNQLSATINDTLNHPYSMPEIVLDKVERGIVLNYSTIKNIMPHLKGMQGQIGEISYILENYHKVEKLWDFYEEAKRDGKNLTNNLLVKELTYLSKYTLYLLDESLSKILAKLNNENLRLELVAWKNRKVEVSKQIYQQDQADLAQLIKMKPSVMENPTLTNTTKLANLLIQRDSLYSIRNSNKVLGEFRKNPSKRIEEVELFYTCDMKKRRSDGAPQSIMDFTSDKAIQIIRLDREIYKFRNIALNSLPYKEQQYFKLKKQLAIASIKQEVTKRKIIKRKVESDSHYALILKEYNRLINSFSFEEQSMLRTKEKIFNHDVIATIEFWGCPDYFPAFYEK